MRCSKCGSKDIDFQEAGGQSICVSCGTVLEESTIVSSIEFQESGDRSHVIGQYVAANCTKPYSSGSRMMGRHMDLRDARDATLLNARRAISQVASTLRLPQIYIDRAYRLYQLALQRSFIFGRRQTHIVSTCLYVVCRQERSPHLLIDFADALQINVYVLGKAFLQFTRVLNITLPVIDPSLYIHRYVSQLDFHDRTNVVIETSLRIITRLKKDWINVGRRPDGVCAAAILISSRAHGFEISQMEIAQLFRISQETVRKRLFEFRSTPSAQLSLQQFHVHDISLEFDPPSFIDSLLQDQSAKISLNFGEKENQDDNNNDFVSPEDLANDEVFADANDDQKEASGILRIDEDTTIEVHVPSKAQTRGQSSSNENKIKERRELYQSLYDETISATSNENKKEALQSEAIIMVANEQSVGGWGASKGSTETERTASLLSVRIGKTGQVETTEGGKEVDISPADDNLDMDTYLFSSEEVVKRQLIWKKTHGSFMEERARRKREREMAMEGQHSDKYTESGKLRKKYARKPQESKTNATTSDAVMAAKSSVKGASKKINYDALKGVFNGDGSFALPAPEAPAPASSSSNTQIKIAKPSESSSSTPAVATIPEPGKPTTTGPNPPVKADGAEDEAEEEDDLIYEGERDMEDDYDDEYY